MKAILLTFLIFFFFVLYCYPQINESKNYYYYNGQKKMLNINKKRLVVYHNANREFEQIFMSKHTVSRKIDPGNYSSGMNDVTGSAGFEVIINDEKNYDSILGILKNYPEIKAVEQVIGDTLPVMMSNHFYVKLKNDSDTSQLNQIARETKTEVLRKVLYTDKWYVLEARKESISNSLDVSNIFYESGYFDKVDPGFILDLSRNCVSDTRYSEQWAIDNTGIDINACGAWDMTTGNSNIVLAVIDQGMDAGHTEFSGVNFTASYDAEDRNSPAQLHGDHGTHICGIISSNHNQADIAGIAPGLSIMNVSYPFSNFPKTVSEDLAAGINWAVQYGAHILNNSWGDSGGLFYNDLHSNLLEDAIDNAIENGRNGLGCIVIFASGNDGHFYPLIDYPAYYRPEILVVGSVTSAGQRPDFSGYGTQLDIVAPGSAILSTINNNQYDSWDGTSMAAPHVSAVAGLILSRHSNLTRAQVVNIIESTAQKIGGYNYQTTAGRPNGTWNDEVGYGLVDAYAAVHAVCTTTNFITYFYNRTVYSNTTVKGCNINIKNVDVQNYSELTIDAQNETTINGPFEVHFGSQLEIK